MLLDEVAHDGMVDQLFEDHFHSDVVQLFYAVLRNVLEGPVVIFIDLDSVEHDGVDQKIFDTLPVLELLVSFVLKYLGERIAVEVELAVEIVFQEYVRSIFPINLVDEVNKIF